MRGYSTLFAPITMLGLGGLFGTGSAVSARADTPTAPKVDVTAPISLRLNEKMEPVSPVLPLRVGMPPAVLLHTAVAAPKQIDPVSVASKVVPIAIRLGALVSPRTKFVGGADFSFPSLKVGAFLRSP